MSKLKWKVIRKADKAVRKNYGLGVKCRQSQEI